MGYIDFSKSQTMTRKEYLKSKKKRVKLPNFKAIFLVLLIIFLSVYVTIQIKKYNTVTLAAKEVIESTSLLKTLKIYYMNSPYEKDGATALTRYSNQDESRYVYEGADSLQDISISGSYIYGIQNNNLMRYKINIVATADDKQYETLASSNILMYTIYNNEIYVVRYNKEENELKNGIYKIVLNDSEEKLEETLLIEGIFYDIAVDNGYIYTLTKGNTSKSLIRYSKKILDKKVISGNLIVSNFYIDDNYISYISQLENGKVYLIKKDTLNNININTLNSTFTKTEFNKKQDKLTNVAIYQNNLIYVSNSDSKIYAYNIDTKENIKLFDDKCTSFIVINEYIYYKNNSNLKVMEYNLKEQKLNYITSIRSSEFVCIR